MAVPAPIDVGVLADQEGVAAGLRMEADTAAITAPTLILPDRVADPSDDAIVLRASRNRAGMAGMRGDEAAFGDGEAGVARDKRQRRAARGGGEDAAIATDPDIGAIIGNTDDVHISMHAPPMKLASALGVRLLAARKPKEKLSAATLPVIVRDRARRPSRLFRIRRCRR